MKINLKKLAKQKGIFENYNDQCARNKNPKLL